MQLYFSRTARVVLMMVITLPVILSSRAALTTRAQVTAQYRLVYIASGFKEPTSVAFSPDGRLFVTELPGKVDIVDPATGHSTVFLDLSAKVKTAVVGQGLYDIAFHPDYSKNGYFYVSFVAANGDATLARFQVSAKDANTADPESEMVVLAIAHPHNFHYGGQIVFGRDGYMYYSMGDGGSAGDKEGNSQNKKSLLGSLIRLDVNHGDPYTIPADNPFANDPAARPELWAKGLRNPWRFSFDQATGDLYIADVGEALYEEIDVAQAGDPGGENYGWSRYEGIAIYNGGDAKGLTFPVIVYGHDNGNCSITGGYVYRGTQMPELVGKYVFGDYCSGTIWSLEHAGNRWLVRQLMTTKIKINSFGQDANGELYVLDDGGGTLFMLSAAA